MRLFRSLMRRRDADIESALRASRPKAPAHLVKAIANRVVVRKAPALERRTRVGAFIAVTATMAVVLGATGGLGAAANGLASVSRSVAHVAGVSNTTIKPPSVSRAACSQYGSPATITGFSPNNGKPGATITVTGSNFTGACAVSDVQLTGSANFEANFYVSSSTTLTFTVPAAATPGSYAIEVTNGYGSPATASPFAVDGAPSTLPTITKFSPTFGPETTSVTITGKNLIGATSISFNGDIASVTGTTATTATAAVPAGATTGPLTVYTASGAATSHTSFLVTGHAPVPTGLSPVTGPVSTLVTITGAYFTGATGVTFGATPGTNFKVVNDGKITVKVPTTLNPGDIVAVSVQGTSTVSAGSFTVNAKKGAPTISSFTPTSGKAGDGPVSIKGKGFTGGTVKFNGVSASGCTVASDTSITGCIVPSTTTGPIQVFTANGEGVSAKPFVINTTPLISGFSPAFGKKGTSVTITGSNLEGATGVSFGGSAVVTVKPSTVKGVTTIKVAVPASAATGAITVYEPGGFSATSGDVFTIVTKPATFTFTPDHGSVGSTFTITASSSPGGFLGTQSVTIGGKPALFHVTDNEHISVTVLAGDKTGPVIVKGILGSTSSGTAKYTVS